MCTWGNNTLVNVKIQADLSCTGKEKWRDMQIDSCIASIVQALQEGGIDMRGCCCGHGSGLGDIHLQDGRMLLIIDDGGAFLADQKSYLQKIIKHYEGKDEEDE